jgi:hypothetical protein
MTSWDTDRPLFEGWILEHWPETDLTVEESDLLGDEFYLDPETNKLFAAFSAGLSFQKHSG